jgi:hypothetical protein
VAKEMKNTEVIKIERDGFFNREVKTYSVVYQIKLKKTEPVLKAKPVFNYEDTMGWVNETVLSSGEMYVTSNRIRWGKKKVLEYMQNEALKQYQSAKERYDYVKKVRM